jgi:hypothetical protein
LQKSGAAAEQTESSPFCHPRKVLHDSTMSARTTATATIPTASQQDKEEEPSISTVDSHHFDTKWLVVSQVLAFLASFLWLVIDPFLFVDPPMIMCSIAMIILLIPCCCRNKYVLYLAAVVTGALSLLLFSTVIGVVIDCIQGGCFDDDDDYHGDDQTPHDDQAYDDDDAAYDDDYDPDDDFWLFLSMVTASAFLWAVSSYCMVCFARSGGIIQSRRASSPDDENKNNNEDYQLLASE